MTVSRCVSRVSERGILACSRVLRTRSLSRMGVMILPYTARELARVCGFFLTHSEERHVVRVRDGLILEIGPDADDYDIACCALRRTLAAQGDLSEAHVHGIAAAYGFHAHSALQARALD